MFKFKGLFESQFGWNIFFIALFVMFLNNDISKVWNNNYNGWSVFWVFGDAVVILMNIAWLNRFIYGESENDDESSSEIETELSIKINEKDSE